MTFIFLSFIIIIYERRTNIADFPPIGGSQPPDAKPVTPPSPSPASETPSINEPFKVPDDLTNNAWKETAKDIAEGKPPPWEQEGATPEKVLSDFLDGFESRMKAGATVREFDETWTPENIQAFKEWITKKISLPTSSIGPQSAVSSAGVFTHSGWRHDKDEPSAAGQSNEPIKTEPSPPDSGNTPPPAPSTP